MNVSRAGKENHCYSQKNKSPFGVYLMWTMWIFVLFCFEVYFFIKVVIQWASTAFDWIILCLYVWMTIATTKWNLSTLPFVFGCSFGHVVVCVCVCQFCIYQHCVWNPKAKSKYDIYALCSIYRIKFHKKKKNEFMLSHFVQFWIVCHKRWCLSCSTAALCNVKMID